MLLQQANDKQLDKWDSYIDTSINGTLFHKKAFLKYHGDRFKDRECFLVFTNGTEIFALMSMAVLKGENGKVTAKSPYGASYGGVVFMSQPSYSEGKEVVLLLINYIKENCINEFIITQPPSNCCIASLDTFTFNLLENGFESITRDITSTLFLDKNQDIWKQMSGSMRRGIRKSIDEGIKISENENLNFLYSVLEKEQMEKFQCRPTHTAEEFILLHELFPKEVFSYASLWEQKLIAGITCFQLREDVYMSFYLYHDTDFKHLNGLRPAVWKAIEKVIRQDGRIFDFGTSSVHMKGHESVFRFKEGFSKVGIFRETLKYTNI